MFRHVCFHHRSSKKAPNNGTDREYQPEVTKEFGGGEQERGAFNASPFFKQDLSAVAALIGWKVNNF